MKNKKIAVLVKYCGGELNPFDGAALQCALDTGAEVVVVTMAPMSVRHAFEGLTRYGVRAVLLSDALYAGSDTVATSLVLAAAVRRLAPDLVFCGRQSVDGDTAQVPPMLARRLGFTIKAKAIGCDGTHITLRSGETFVPASGTLITFEKMRTLAFPSLFSRPGSAEVWDNGVLGIEPRLCGLNGSPTRVVRAYESRVGRRKCTVVGRGELSGRIAEGLRSQRVRSAPPCGAQGLDCVYYVGDIADVAQSIAKRAVCYRAEGKTPAQIAQELAAAGAHTVLWEDSERNKLIAPQAAVLLDAGMCADCISFRAQDGKLVMTRPAQGGNVTADIICTGAYTFATVRTAHREGADVLFCIGRGALERRDAIERMAQETGAEVCCTRPVADEGFLPYTAQVGLTGRTVAPKVYVAFGVSGAVQHTCAIERSGTVIAVNCDASARIFDYADYGIIQKI